MIKSLWRIRFTVIPPGHPRNNEVVSINQIKDAAQSEALIKETNDLAAIIKQKDDATGGNTVLATQTWARIERIA